MTWLVLGRSSASHQRALHLMSESTASSTAIKAARSDIICKPDYAVWETVWSDRFTGCIYFPKSGDAESEEEQIHVECEAYFSIEALLSDIMARREKMFALCSSLPDYFYNLISVSDDGRVITLVLVFAEEHLDVRPAQHFSRTLNSLCVHLWCVPLRRERSSAQGALIFQLTRC